ncbi:MAG: hypothetical protein S0880_25650 [Actinomycetota bacterium]|nr:hypothetical protein [Actinomycetota bacterium]
MITTGFRFYFGLAALYLAAATLYAWTTGGVDWNLFPGNMGTFAFQLTGALTFGYIGGVGDHVGYSILAGAGIVSMVVAFVVVGSRDGNARVLARVAGTERAPAVQVSASPNWWGPAAAFALGAIVIGLVVDVLLVIAGIVLGAIVLFEWVMAAWADRATGDPEANAALRNRLMGPLEVPIIGALVVGFVAVSLSRLFLAVGELAAVVAAGVASTLVLVIAIVLASVPRLASSVVAAVVALGAAGILAAGVVSAAVGEREFEVHGAEHGEEEHSETEGGAAEETESDAGATEGEGGETGAEDE